MRTSEGFGIILVVSRQEVPIGRCFNNTCNQTEKLLDENSTVARTAKVYKFIELVRQVFFKLLSKKRRVKDLGQ